MATSSRLLFVDDAAILLHDLTDHDGLKWRRSITQLLNEMARNPITPSAIRRRIPRGDRHIWGEIELHRINGKKAYRESDLRDWYETHAKPILEREDAEVKTGMVLSRLSRKRLAMAGKKAKS
jgi:hypothetical protein